MITTIIHTTTTREWLHDVADLFAIICVAAVVYHAAVLAIVLTGGAP